MLPHEVVLELAVLVLGPGMEATDHADVSSLGKNAFLRHFFAFRF
jgi:hypothetical protein